MNKSRQESGIAAEFLFYYFSLARYVKAQRIGLMQLSLLDKYIHSQRFTEAFERFKAVEKRLKNLQQTIMPELKIEDFQMLYDFYVLNLPLKRMAEKKKVSFVQIQSRKGYIVKSIFYNLNANGYRLEELTPYETISVS